MIDQDNETKSDEADDADENNMDVETDLYVRFKLNSMKY